MINFEYYWYDFKTAAKKTSREQGLLDRSVFIKKDIINVYPGDSGLGQHISIQTVKFEDKKYDNDLIDGIDYKQARAYYIWEIEQNNLSKNVKDNPVGKMVIPSKEQWERFMSEKNIEQYSVNISLPSKIFYYFIE